MCVIDQHLNRSLKHEYNIKHRIGDIFSYKLDGGKTGGLKSELQHLMENLQISNLQLKKQFLSEPESMVCW